MGRHVALLRAVNVGGRNRVVMADLRKFFAHLGLESVQTLLQSGNVVFSSQSRAGKTLERTLEARFAARFGLEAAFFVRSARQWSDIVEKNPFSQEARKNPGKLAVVFLKRPASASAIRSLEGAITGNEYVSGARGHVYVVYSDGIGRSRLTASVIEKALGGPGTARNWNTILKLQAAVSQAMGAA